MKALLSYEAGGPETLRFEEIADPAPGPGEVLVRVAAVSLNFPDALVIEDRYQFKPQRPFSPGNEISGVIVALGEGVSDLAVGDRVCALCGFRGLAELVAVDAWRTFVIPDGMPLDIAATLMMTYGTGLYGLRDRGELRAGETLLVLGAAGGVGMAAVELGKALGARVVGAVSSPEKAEAVRKAGADEVVIYPRAPLDRPTSKVLANSFKAACPDGYDVIYDPVGGDYAEPALRSIGWEGRYAVVGFTAGIPKVALNLTLLKACDIVGVFWGAWTLRNRNLFREDIATLIDFWSAGKIKPAISERLPFEAAPEAIARLRDRLAVGKLVVELGRGG
jgi:NADPH:quinone reductase-like Zn-dependent oxidoreductase